MLEFMRRQSQSWLVWLALGIIIVVFIFFFGPQAGGFDPRSASWAAKVNGHEIQNTQLEATLGRLMRTGQRLEGDAFYEAKRDVMEDYAAIELLATRAREAGLAISNDELRCYIVNWDRRYAEEGRFLCRQFPRSYETLYPNVDIAFYSDRAGNFTSNFTSDVRRWFQLSVDAYEAYKRDELLALRYLDVLGRGVPVARAELEARYERRNSTIDVQYVRFDAVDLDEEDLSEEEVAAWLAANEARVQAHYDANQPTYELPRQLEIRRIFIRKPGNEDGDDYAAAEARYERLLEAAEADDVDFAALAAENTDLENEAENGGSMGIRPASALSQEFVSAADEMTTGEVRGVEQQYAWNIIQLVSDQAAGVQPLAEVQDDIARELMVLDARNASLQAQRAQAEALLARSQAEGSVDAAVEAMREEAETQAAAASASEGAEDAAPETDAAEGDAGQEQAEQAAPEMRVRNTGPFALEPEAPSLEGIDPQLLQYIDIASRSAAEVPTIGEYPQLMAELWQLSDESPVVGRVVSFDGALYVLSLEERTEAAEPSDAELAEIYALLQRERSEAVVGFSSLQRRLLLHTDDPFPPTVRRMLDEADIRVRQDLFEEPERRPEG